MTLSFPTLAEQALAAFRRDNKDNTVSLALVAKQFGATVEHHHRKTIYNFDDDTWLEVTGRGINHKVEAHLP